MMKILITKILLGNQEKSVKGLNRVKGAARAEEEQLTENVKVIINLNAFIILAENKCVDIAIVAITVVDNTVYPKIY
jgi:hypothetical protein